MKFAIWPVVVGLVLASCSPAPAQPAAKDQPGGGAAATGAQSAASTDKAKFNELVQKAKASDGRLRSSLSDVDSTQVRGWEAGFEQRFGIPLHLDNEPGHPTEEVVPRVLQANKSGKGVVDWFSTGTTGTQAMLMRDSALRIPPWDALAQEWPQATELRTMYANAPGGPNNTSLSDYCMLSRQGVYAFVYNTRKVKPEEVKGLVWDDMLLDKWKGRVAFASGAGGLYTLPFHKDWPIERMKAYSQNLGANGLKLPPGGSQGVLQVVSQGEADIGVTVLTSATDEINRGSPLAIAWPEVVPINDMITCLPSLPVNNPELGALFFGWRNFEGEWMLADMGNGGARPFYAPEADKYPLGKMIKDAGLSPDQNLASPKTEKDVELLEPYRTAALEGMKTGIQTGVKVAYPWGCARNHPSCVPG